MKQLELLASLLILSTTITFINSEALRIKQPINSLNPEKIAYLICKSYLEGNLSEEFVKNLINRELSGFKVKLIIYDETGRKLLSVESEGFNEEFKVIELTYPIYFKNGFLNVKCLVQKRD